MTETLKRIISGFTILPILIFILFNDSYHAAGFSVAVVIIGLICYWEIRRLFKHVGIYHTYLVPISLVVYYCCLIFNGLQYIAIIFVLLFLFESIYWMRKERDFHQMIYNIFSAIFILFYLGFLWGSTISLRHVNLSVGVADATVIVGSSHFLILLAGTWMCDIGAYFGGKLLGRTKLNLSISPNKTLEGFLSGIVVALSFLYFMCFQLNISFHLLMILLPLGTIIGDLFESLIKRAAQIKDSSNIIPGHGGMLDVFDALILTTPIYYYCILPFVS